MVLTWRQSTDEASRLQEKQENEEGEREEEKRGKKNARCRATRCCTSQRICVHRALLPANFRDEIVPGIYLS